MKKTTAPEKPAPTSSADLHRSITYHYVPLASIIPSPTNPRKHFDENSIIDLAESMKVSGLIQPITLRPIGDRKYEIVAGERRFRAAQLLSWTDIHAGVSDISDTEILELQIIENLQREDVRPLDEAAAFKSLLEKQTIDWLAGKIHKPKKYISDRLKLNDLIPAAADHVSSGMLPLGHAVVISKLNVRDQEKTIGWCIGRNYAVINSEEIQCHKTIEAIKDFIAREFMLDFDNVPFDPADPLLYEIAGACQVCSKRTCNNNLLFSDITDEDKCTDSGCFNKKLELHLSREKEKATTTHGKFLAGEKTSYASSGSVRVSGIDVPYKMEAFKGSVAVVVTKVDRGSHSRKYLGNIVFVQQGAITRAKNNKMPTGSGSSAPVQSWKTREDDKFKKVVWPRLQLLQNLSACTEQIETDYFCKCLNDIEDRLITSVAVVLDLHPVYNSLDDVMKENSEIDEDQLLPELRFKIVDHFGVAIMPAVLMFLMECEGSDSSVPTNRTIHYNRFDYTYQEVLKALTLKEQK